MTKDFDQDDEFDPIEPKSKSQVKREMTALQELGEALVKLTINELNKIPLDDDLRQAILTAKNISSREAKRRQLQYVGRLMRDQEPAPIQKALDSLRSQDEQSNARLHRLEKYRDELIAQGDEAIARIVTIFPTADRQILRQFIRKAKKELESNQTSQAARSLFRYLRDLPEEPNL